MKVILLLMVLALVGCTSDSVDYSGEIAELRKEIEELKSQETQNSAEAAKTVKIGNLEVMTKDLGQMTWDQAMKACADLGDGWRLPTKDELNILYENKDKIGGFASNYWWSSTEGGDYSAWFQYFSNGFQNLGGKDFNGLYVRAVRTF